jgi:2-dehydropantoate 2-reductase
MRSRIAFFFSEFMPAFYRYPLAIVGPGALGLAFAHRIARHSRVAVVARNAVRAARLREGITVGGEAYAPEAFDAQHLPHAEWAILLVKAPQTAAAARSAAAMAPRGVLSLQNGLVVEALRGALPPEAGLLADQGVTFEAAFREGDQVHRAGGGDTLLPPGFEALAQLLRHAGFAARIEPAIHAARLEKLLVNACINPLSALYRIRNGELAAPPYREQVRALAVEAARILAAEEPSIEVTQAPERVLKVIEATARNRSSMLQDVMAGRPTEIDAMTGALLRIARRHGLAAPLHEELLARVSALPNVDKEWSGGA